MTPTQFVERVKAWLGPEVFGKVAKMAADGKMGFGSNSNQWGSKDSKL